MLKAKWGAIGAAIGTIFAEATVCIYQTLMVRKELDIKNYLNKIDKVNSNKLKEHGVKGFAFQIELSQETIDYLNNI